MPPESQDEKKESPPVSGAEVKAKEYWEQILRLRADFENTKKRLEKDRQESIRFANEKLLQEILPIMDNLDRAMVSLAEGHDPEKVNAGLKIAQEELHGVLEQHGVQVIRSLGAEFDPQLHEAVGVVESADLKEGQIADEIQRGYLLNGRLLRPSRVRIVKQKTEDRGQKTDK